MVFLLDSFFNSVFINSYRYKEFFSWEIFYCYNEVVFFLYRVIEIVFRCCSSCIYVYILDSNVFFEGFFIREENGFVWLLLV